MGKEVSTTKPLVWVCIVLVCGSIAPVIGRLARLYWISTVGAPDLGPFLWSINSDLMPTFPMPGFLILAYALWQFRDRAFFNGHGHIFRIVGMLLALCIVSAFAGWDSTVTIPEDGMFSFRALVRQGAEGLLWITLIVGVYTLVNLVCMALGLAGGQLMYLLISALRRNL